MLSSILKETKIYQEIKAEGEASVILRLLRKRFGELPEGIPTLISALKLMALDELSETLLDFSDISEVESWLNNHADQK